MWYVALRSVYTRSAGSLGNPAQDAAMCGGGGGRQAGCLFYRSTACQETSKITFAQISPSRGGSERIYLRTNEGTQSHFAGAAWSLETERVRVVGFRLSPGRAGPRRQVKLPSTSCAGGHGAMTSLMGSVRNQKVELCTQGVRSAPSQQRVLSPGMVADPGFGHSVGPPAWDHTPLPTTPHPPT